MGDEFKLCYVDGCFAWFTTADLKDQWGDDWNDAPYEHNAGCPYEWKSYRECPEYKLQRVVFHDAILDTPCGFANGNSAYSVEDINSGKVAWLATPRWTQSNVNVSIHAGVSIDEFERLIRLSGGNIYVPKPAELPVPEPVEVEGMVELSRNT